MSPDQTPIADSEVLLRWVPSDPAKFHFPSGPVDLRAFLPNLKDTDGLSLFRQFVEGTESPFLSPTELLARAPGEKVREFGGIAAILALSIRQIEPLTVIPKPDEIPGHACIPEMNRVAYDSSKEQKRIIMDWADKLARACLDPMPILPKPLPQAKPS